MIKVRQLIFLSYIMTIGYISVLPAESVQINVWDKLSHLLGYGLMTLLAAWSLPDKKSFLISLPLMVFYGLTLEWGQSFTPDRFASWQDGIANTIGIILCAAAVFLSKNIQMIAQCFPLHTQPKTSTPVK